MKPSEWLDATEMDQTLEKVKQQEQTATEGFRTYRNNFIDETLEKVANQQTVSIEQHEHRMGDYIDLAIEQDDKHICKLCHCAYQKTKLKCPNCGHDPNHYDSNFDPYYRTNSCHPSLPTVMAVGDPHLVNPNTENNVKQVLSHLQNVCELSEKRSWTIVWSDGVPYIYSKR